MERDPRDCCCVIFTAKQGVTIIGWLLWIGLALSCISIFGLVMVTLESDVSVFYNWYILPNIIVCLILGIQFCNLRSAEGTERDYEARKNFAKCYLVLGVFVMAGLYVGSFIAGIVQLNAWCDNNYGDQAYECS